MSCFSGPGTRARAAAALLGAAFLSGAGPGPGPASALAPSLLPATVGAGERVATDGRSGLALGGFDPVAYRLDGAATAGSARFEAVWGGVAWRFAREANRAAFLRDPAAFLPALGGYDALAASRGRIVGADPAVFALVDGRLYLFRSAGDRRVFLAGAHLRAAAEAEWTRLAAGLVAR